MSFDKIEFVKPNDILQGGFNPNLPAEISVQEQLLYSIANNLAILNNNLINSGALQNMALIGDLLQEIFTDERIANKKSSVFKTAENATSMKNNSVFIGNVQHPNTGWGLQENMGMVQVLRLSLENQSKESINFWTSKSTTAVVNQATSTYSFNVPVPSVSVSSSPATVNVSASAPVVNNNVPVPHVTNTVQSAVPDITVNATAPIVNNNVPVPSVSNTVQSAVPDITVNATAPVVNVSSSPATVNVSSTAPIVNNNVPVPSVTNTVQSAVAPINVSSTAPVVNVSSSPAKVEVDAYDDSDLILKLNEVKETLETALMSEVETDVKMGLADIVFERDNINLIDYPVEMLTEPASTKKLREF